MGWWGIVMLVGIPMFLIFQCGRAVQQEQIVDKCAKTHLTLLSDQKTYVECNIDYAKRKHYEKFH